MRMGYSFCRDVTLLMEMRCVRRLYLGIDNARPRAPFSGAVCHGVTMLRLWIWPLLLLAAVLVPGTLQAKPAPDRIVAVGDLHGDYEAWEAIAQAAGLVDAKGRWSGGSTTLVQMGDIADRGPDSLKIIR